MQSALAHGINLRDFGDGTVGVNLDETVTRADLRDLLAVFGGDANSDVDALAEQAIDLFDDHVRTPLQHAAGDEEEEVRRTFERLLPRATQIVALHFQRTVVARALARLRGRGEESALERALDATQKARLEVSWR